MALWNRATNSGLLTSGDPNGDDSSRAFNAGRIDDALPMGGALLLASPYSGVWNTNEFKAIPAFNFTEWFPKPNMVRLALGIQSSEHVYAGGDALYETDTTQTFPLPNWKQIPIPSNTAQILDIVVLKNSRKIVLACLAGLFWSGIPDSGGSYSWVQVLDPNNVGKPWTTGFSCITEGPNETVVVGIWGSGDPLNSGLYHGKFNIHFRGGHRVTRLDMTRSTLTGSNQPAWTSMGRISMRSFPGDRGQVFALVGDFKTDVVYRTLRSTDGGNSWSNTGNVVLNNNSNNGALWENISMTGNQGWYNNCIDVSPLAPDNNSITVAIGWRSAYFVTHDSGNTWTQFPVNDPHLHGDIHCVRFDPQDQTGKVLYICSDGGVGKTDDGGTTYTSRQNVQLYNQLVTHLTCSYQNPGLVAVSCQDLGDNYCNVDSTVTKAWKEIEVADSDGTSVVFTRNGRLLNTLNTLAQNNVEYGNLVRDWIYDSSSETFRPQVYGSSVTLSHGVIPVDGTNNGGLQYWLFGLDGDIGPFAVPPCPMDIVNDPAYKNSSGEAMIAIAARGPKTIRHHPHTWIEILGLFSNIDDGNWQSNKAHWTSLGIGRARDGEHPMCVGSSDGTVVWVGTGQGRILRFDADNQWTVTDTTPTGNGEAICRFVLNNDTNNFSVSTGLSLFKTSTTNGGWAKIPGPATTDGYRAFTTDWTVSPKVLYLTTYNQIWVSRDNATTWQNISGQANGLPVVPNITDIQFVSAGAKKRVFLGTYGWGLYYMNV